jgi:hypothetical protein
MLKAVIWLLIGLGLLICLIGVLSGKTIVWFIGFLIMAGGLYQGLKPGGILRKEQVLDTWSALIGSGQGRSDEIFRDAEAFIKESKAPSIEIEKKSIAPGMVKGLLGKRRDFLLVTDKQNIGLKPYQIFINARDYGDNLDISWYLTFRPSIWQALLSLIPFVSAISRSSVDLDLFDQMDLRAYATNVHHCLLGAVEKLMLGLNQDPSRLDRKSRGFLGIS